MTGQDPEKKKDELSSPEERLAWLRERGVVVETPEERRAAQISQIMREPDEPVEDEMESISFVLVPHDSSKPLKELFFDCPIHSRPSGIGSSGDALAEYLKPFFSALSSGKEVDLSLFQEKATTTLGSADAGQVSQEVLRKVTEQGHVENFSLVHATPSNHFTGVNIYLDEVGMLKRLPLNPRASKYAARAGFNPSPTFYGDVFIGRVKSQPVLRNVSFKLGRDTAMDAPWLESAAMQNLEHQTALNSITGRNEVQASNDGEDGVAKAEVGYSWTQTEEELELVVPLPKDATSKDVGCKFLPQFIQVKVQKESVVALQLFERVDPDGCTWTLETDAGKGEKKLVITMEKMEQVSWPRIKD